VSMVVSMVGKGECGGGGCQRSLLPERCDADPRELSIDAGMEDGTGNGLNMTCMIVRRRITMTCMIVQLWL
jgi:hypothetical protein